MISTRAGGSNARLTGPQGSGPLRAGTLANALVILERDVTRVEAGEQVTVELLDSPVL